MATTYAQRDYPPIPEIKQIGVFYETADETLARNGFAPNRKGANQGFLRKPMDAVA